MRGRRGGGGEGGSFERCGTAAPAALVAATGLASRGGLDEAGPSPLGPAAVAARRVLGLGSFLCARATGMGAGANTATPRAQRASLPSSSLARDPPGNTLCSKRSTVTGVVARQLVAPPPVASRRRHRAARRGSSVT